MEVPMEMYSAEVISEKTESVKPKEPSVMDYAKMLRQNINQMKRIHRRDGGGLDGNRICLGNLSKNHLKL